MSDVNYLLETLSNDVLYSAYSKSEDTVAMQIAKSLNTGGVKNSIEYILKNYPGVEMEIAQIGVLMSAWQSKTLHLFDEKRFSNNKYIVHFFKSESERLKDKTVDDILKICFKVVTSSSYGFNSVLNDYKDYIKLSPEQKEQERKLRKNIDWNTYYGSIRKFPQQKNDDLFDVLVKHQKVSEALKKLNQIDDFEHAFIKLNLKRLTNLISLMKVLGDSEKLVNKFTDTEILKSAKEGSLVKANYYWKCLSYKSDERFASILNNELMEMKASGSPSYMDFVSKITKYVEANPSLAKSFPVVMEVNSLEEDMFMDASEDGIYVNIHVAALQKMDKKRKVKANGAIGYQMKIVNAFANLKDCHFIDNLQVVVNNEDLNAITVLFKYRESSGFERSLMKKLYEDIIVEIVDSEYQPRVEVVNAKTLEFIMNQDQKSLPKSTAKATKVVKM